MSIIVSTTELNDNIYHGRKQTVLAVLWGPDEGEGYRLYRKGHLPTALYCDPTAALAGLPGSGHGRNPLPDPHQLQAWFNKWGLQENSQVVVYDDGRGPLAGRAWWTLRWAGMTNVQILDGGLAAWNEQSFDLVGGPGNFAANANATVIPHSMPVSTLEDVVNRTGILVDNRDALRFAGKREVLDLKAGHIPGAVNVPVRDLLNEDRTFRTPEEIRERFARAGVSSGENVIVYSGSGNHSALALAAMEYAGIGGASHYVGGWSQWSANPRNPVERGE